MDPKHKKIIKEFKKSNFDPISLLEHIVATTLDEDLMEKFKLSTNKRKVLRNFQCQYFKTRQINEYKQPTIELYPEIPFKNTSHEDQRNYARKCPQNTLKAFPEKTILKLISVIDLKIKFPEIVDEILSETRDEFVKILHNISVNCKILPMANEEGLIVLQPPKFTGKTTKDPVFLTNRCKLKQKWKLHHNLVRNVVEQCENILPEVLFNLTTYQLESYNFINLCEKFKEDLRNSLIILNKLYKQILVLIDESQNCNQEILEICNGILTAYLIKTLTNTINHLVDCTTTVDSLPYVEFNLIFDNCLTTEPSIDKVIGLYGNLIFKLSQITGDFHNLTTKEQLRISLPKDFLNLQKRKICKNLTKFYKPISDYVESLDKEFKEIYNRKMENLDNFTFKLGCELIDNYQKYLNKTTEILMKNKYFDIGQLNVTHWTMNLKQTIQDRTNKVFFDLTKLHQQENQLICNEFEMIKQKLFDIPKNTHNLMLHGRSMIAIKTTYLIQLRERIKVSLEKLIKLIDFGNLTEEHIRINSITILWLKNIEPIIEKGSINYEQLKSEAEERIFAKIQQVNQNLNDLYTKFNCLNSMKDFDNVHQYIQQINNYKYKLRNIYNDINWINSEEKILNYRKTNFEKFNKIINFLCPFVDLLKICLNITRKINVWLYGQFEFLNSEEAKDFLESTNNELMKIERKYREQLRQQEPDLRFDGFIDNPDIEKWPTPLKLIQIGIDKLEDFEPYLRWMKVWCNDALTKEHWKEMSEIAGIDLTPTAGTTLKKLIDLNLTDIEKYEIVSNNAKKQ